MKEQLHRHAREAIDASARELDANVRALWKSDETRARIVRVPRRAQVICAAADLHAVTLADREVHAHVAVARVTHVIQVRPGVVHRRVVRDDQRTRRQFRLEQLGHRKVQLLPAVEQHELDRAVDIGQRGQRITLQHGDEIVEPGLGERLRRRGHLRRAEFGGDDATAAVVAHRRCEMDRRDPQGTCRTRRPCSAVSPAPARTAAGPPRASPAGRCR